MKLTKTKIICVVAACAVIAAINLIPKFKEQPAPVPETVYSVRTERIKVSQMQEYMMMNGSVKAENSIAVLPDVSGKLTEVLVTLGSYVNKGQLIARVDQSSAGYNYNKTPVYAPIAGYITSLPLTVGTTVTQESQIAHIGNITNLQIEAKIPESKIGAVKNGLSALVSLEAYKDEAFPAHIFRLSPIIDETSRTEDVYFVFDVTDPRIKVGMYVRIKLNTALHENVLSVPTDSILQDGNEKCVFIANNGSAIKKIVETGVVVDGRTEIVTGLREGDDVVVEGMQVLSDNAKINVLGGR